MMLMIRYLFLCGPVCERAFFLLAEFFSENGVVYTVGVFILYLTQATTLSFYLSVTGGMKVQSVWRLK